jgi:hypothetical protein
MFHATKLDRNQIIRAALFAAAHSEQFLEILEPYMKKEAPAPKWSLSDNSYWLAQKAKGEDVNDDGSTEVKKGDGDNGDDGRGRVESMGEPAERRTGTIPSGSIRVTGGALVYKVN